MNQVPAPGSRLLKWAGDALEVTLNVPGHRAGRAVFRTNVGGAAVRRRELIDHNDRGTPIAARDWHDLPMAEVEPGCWRVSLPLAEVGLFRGKACFFPEGKSDPEWPAGDDLRIKVEPACTASGNTMYTAFVRLFGSTPRHHDAERELDARGYTVIPRSGTFRELIRRLDTIMGAMRFRIVQLLPIHPTPTVYGRMGRFGSPFAATDFLSVNPELAEFDVHATPLDQFRELVDAVHARSGFLYIDLPANHTGWASTLQTHHPQWYKRRPDGAFASPGAWGVTWEDLVELDFSSPELRTYMAEVFLFWCRQGVDGFRCDAGYMIPVETWSYIIARVRDEFPDTVFMLEGLGGPVETTRRLLEEADMNWAYSELFQTEGREALDGYLPSADAVSSSCGPLIHFAETHDNARLAARGGKVYARMRVGLSALLSRNGAFGISNGVEWFATEKIDVHEATSLNWGANENLVSFLARLNHLLFVHPAFGPGVELLSIRTAGAATLAWLRKAPTPRENLLVLINLDCEREAEVAWDAAAFPGEGEVFDLLAGEGGDAFTLSGAHLRLPPGGVSCLALHAAERLPDPLSARQAALNALRAGARAEEPLFVTHYQWPRDVRRVVPLPLGDILRVQAEHPFTAVLTAPSGRVVAREVSVSGSVALMRAPQQPGTYTLEMAVYTPAGIRRTRSSLLVPDFNDVPIACAATDHFDAVQGVLSNGAGAMSYARGAWGTLQSQYDCLLGVNPDAEVPADKVVFWTRCRAWVRVQGFSAAVDATCQERFDVDPAGRFMEWRFRVPCGAGKRVPLVFRLELVEGQNQARLKVARLVDSAADTLAPEIVATVIFRPDVEWRSFHSPTKAYAGAEAEFAQAVEAGESGFRFRPWGAQASLEISHGAFHVEPEWTYMVAHPIEADRGLDAAGDLYSPGWFDAPLQAGEETTLTAAAGAPRKELLYRPQTVVAEGHRTKALRAWLDLLSRSLDLFVVRRNAFKTVIAGYPWFLDWGRDTLIVLRGMVAAGRHEETLEILKEFGRFEEKGTLPNIIHGERVGNRDTSDAPLFYCLVAEELDRAVGGVREIEVSPGRTMGAVVESIVRHIKEGTPNGVKMDASSGLVFSPPHFTWMDTNYPACTPREGYPVEIQALWIRALQLVAKWSGDAAWSALAQRALASLRRLFARPGGGLADCLRAKPGVPAEQALVEDAIRPNQLFAVTLGLLPREEARGVLRVTEQLLVPGAIRSLADAPVACDLGIVRNGVQLNDGHAPYWGCYRGDEDTRRKPAYHNGTAWSWQAPMYAESLVQVFGERAKTKARALLATAAPSLRTGALGHLPEICDGDAPHAARGCSAQAWGVSELLRVLCKM